MPLGGPPRRGKPSPKEMREILTDWYLAVWVQKQTGNATVRNGVELRMMEMAHNIYSLPPTPSEGQE